MPASTTISLSLTSKMSIRIPTYTASSKDDVWLPELLLVFSVVLALFFIFYGAAGLRGTDQYWYVSDVESLSLGLEHVTNNYFPGPMLREGAVPENNYFMHNSPVMWLVGWIARYVDAYAAWILVNTLCHVIVGICVYFVAKRTVARKIAMILTAFYFISPIAIWQTINPLLEMYYAALVGLQLFLFFYRDQALNRYVLYLLLLIGALSHPIFLAPACLWGVYSLVGQRKGKKAVYFSVLVLYVVALFIFLKFKGIWLPSSFQPELKAIIASVVPGSSNMYWHYSEKLPAIDFALMKSKVLHALQTHFFVAKFAPLYLFTNVALIATIYLILVALVRRWKVLVPLGLFGCQYLVMIVLQQNHPRFQQIVAVVTFVVIGVAVSEMLRVRQVSEKYIVFGIVVCFLIVSVFSGVVVNTGRNQSLAEREEVKRLKSEFEILPVDAKIVGINVKPHNPFSYIVRPREMLFIRTDMLRNNQIKQAIEIFKPEYLIVRNGDYVIEGSLIASISSRRFGELLVYEVLR